MFGKRSETYTNLHLYKALRLTNYVRDSLHFCATRRFRGSIVRDLFTLRIHYVLSRKPRSSVKPPMADFFFGTAFRVVMRPFKTV